MMQPQPKRDQMMLELFRQKMVNELTEEAMQAIRPAVERAAHSVVREMRAEIQAEYREQGRDLVVRLAVGLPPQ